MATRHGVRARPVDVNRELNLVLDEVDLDVDESTKVPSASEKQEKVLASAAPNLQVVIAVHTSPSLCAGP